MRQKQIIRELSEDQLQKEREAAASKAAELVVEEIRSELRELDTSLQLLKGIVDRRTLADLYGCDSTETIMKWERRLGFKRVDGPDRKRIWYDLEDVKAKVRASGVLED